MPWSYSSPYVPPQHHSNYIPPSSDHPAQNGFPRAAAPRPLPWHRGGAGGRAASAGRGFSRPRDPSHRNSRFPAEEQENGDAINFDAYDSVPVEASGKDVPPPVNVFDDTDLDEGLKRNIKRCKYVKPTPVQRHAIPIATAGRDLMACAQTGSGKTAAFCFPIISGILKGRSSPGFSPVSRGVAVAYPTALILSPTRELSCQIRDEANKFAFQTGVKVVVAYGGSPIIQQLRLLEKGVDILVATPGRLVDIIERERVSLERIKYLALDEADRMLDMGFERQIRKIVEKMHMPPPGIRQTLLFSATFPNDIQKLASDFLSDYIFLSVGRVGSSTELIVQKIELVQDTDKRDKLVDHLCGQKVHGTNGKHALTLVFVETKRGADALESWLSKSGFPAIAIHGDKVQMERERALRSFKSGHTPILVATDVASRGLDIPHVAHVINFDLPRDIDDYVHRIGRTGRAGKSGLATAFFSDKNSPMAKALVGLLQEANQEVPSWLSQFAECSSSGGRGRGYGSQRYSSGSYGGRDFRNPSEPEVQSYNCYGSHGNADNAVESFSTTSYVDTSYDMQNSLVETSFDNLNISCNYDEGDVNSVELCGGGVAVGEEGPSGYASIVPTGWD
ncbi:ATP-dependent RNA helicase [Vigna unguiculata]|uniref:RNA helicase n=1 Tax=Vigna unguiculata TaxID=3917 RepID=A0A4D6KVL2_VIGUN|nr:ATP-dependent RNA helicase [Vigna unguiculata]